MLYAVIAGAILAIVLYIAVDAVKLFIPRRHHARIDRGTANLGRWVGRVVVLIVLGFVGFMVWLANFSGY